MTSSLSQKHPWTTQFQPPAKKTMMMSLLWVWGITALGELAIDVPG